MASKSFSFELSALFVLCYKLFQWIACVSLSSFHVFQLRLTRLLRRFIYLLNCRFENTLAPPPPPTPPTSLTYYKYQHNLNFNVHESFFLSSTLIPTFKHGLSPHPLPSIPSRRFPSHSSSSTKPTYSAIPCIPPFCRFAECGGVISQISVRNGY